ncbi:MAG: DUF4352 domain-containing protein [Bacilli bacterium]|nr:DUF4352 domain-containing protein [Bacilli bacterium]
MEKKKTPIWLVVICVIIGIFLLIGILGNSDETGTNSDSNDTTTVNTNSDSKKKKDSAYKLDSPFTFDDLEITIGSQIQFVQNDNQFSDDYQKDVIKIPITVKNLKDETHSLNMFYIKMFGSQGTEINDQSSYFDDSVQFAGDLRPEASYTKYLYYVYDGDGKYTIELNDIAKKIDINLNIAK